MNLCHTALSLYVHIMNIYLSKLQPININIFNVNGHLYDDIYLHHILKHSQMNLTMNLVSSIGLASIQ